MKQKLIDRTDARQLEIYITPDKWVKITVYQFTDIGKAGEAVVWRKAEVNAPGINADAALAMRFAQGMEEAARVAKQWDQERAGKPVTDL
jgi:hypothetical protein